MSSVLFQMMLPAALADKPTVFRSVDNEVSTTKCHR